MSNIIKTAQDRAKGLVIYRIFEKVQIKLDPKLVLPDFDGLEYDKQLAWSELFNEFESLFERLNNEKV